MTSADAESDSLAAIRHAATRLFYEQGYDATSLRQIASAAGLKVGSLYYHIPGKEHLLLDIMCRALDDLLEDTRTAAAGAKGPSGRLRAAVAAHIRFHADRASEVFVGNTELRSLSPERCALVVAKREEYEHFMQGLLAAVGAAGEGQMLDPRVHLYSLMAQAAHVAGWYRPGGRMDVEDLGRAYAELVIRGLSGRPTPLINQTI